MRSKSSGPGLRRLWWIVPVLGLALMAGASPAGADPFIYQRVAFKYILNSNGVRPPGAYASQTKLQEMIDSTNVTLDRAGRGYRFVLEPSEDVAGASQFYHLTQPEFATLQQIAEASPAQYHWRTDAVNIYVPDSSFAGGAAGIPNYAKPGDDVMQWACSNDPVYNDVRLIHELGHHNALWHTFETQGKGFTADCPGDDCVGDTRFDPELSCTTPFGCVTGGGQECCCAAKIQLLAGQPWSQAEKDAIRWNVMSYFGADDCAEPPISEPFRFSNMVLTPDQLDRWADGTRRYHVGEVTGFTYFVDGGTNHASPDGYSDKPYKTVLAAVSAAALAGTTHTVNIRSGTYAEHLTLQNRMALRASRGPVTIQFP